MIPATVSFFKEPIPLPYPLRNDAVFWCSRQKGDSEASGSWGQARPRDGLDVTAMYTFL